MDVTAAIPDWVELVVWVVVAAGAVVGAVVVIWRLGPLRWLRTQIADEASDRMVVKLTPVIERTVADERAGTNERLDMIHAVAAGAELKIEEHIADSRSQHAADLARREERQKHQDAREQDQERRLEHLERGQTQIIDRVGKVERLAVTIARHEGVPVPEAETDAERSEYHG